MSGRAKRNLYTATCCVLAVLAAVGTFFMWYLKKVPQGDRAASHAVVFYLAVVVGVILRPHVIFHELGHLVFGICAGFRFQSISFGRLEISRRGVTLTGKKGYLGSTVMLPESDDKLASKLKWQILGASLCNLVYGVLLLTLYLLLPANGTLSFWAALAPVNLYEGICALLPVELPAGRTDGKMLKELAQKSQYAKAYLIALSAYGKLAVGEYDALDREALFSAPVLRADEPLSLALFLLRFRYLFNAGEETAAKEELEKYVLLFEPDEIPEEALQLTAYVAGVFDCDKEKAKTILSQNALTKSPAWLTYACTGEGLEAALKGVESEELPGDRAVLKKLISRSEQ